jgi:hypothetical protein
MEIRSRLSRIVIGPAANKETAKDAVSSLLRAHGIDPEHLIELSDIPYRG